MLILIKRMERVAENSVENHRTHLTPRTSLNSTYAEYFWSVVASSGDELPDGSLVNGISEIADTKPDPYQQLYVENKK